MNLCHICNKPLTDDVFYIRELYFGTKEKFPYTQCPNCKCIQILGIPTDLGKYYPENYYSKKVKKYYRDNIFLSIFRSYRLNATLQKKPIRHLLTSPNLARWASLTGLNSKSRILDVGCGTGQRILKMRKKGFYHLEGVDPFIEGDIHYSNGVIVHNCELSNLARKKSNHGHFDLVMMHHSLEHIPDQHQTLESAYQLLSSHGKLLIRVPICTSYAWEHYRENWVQLDAPRHLYTHSRKSLEALAASHGFINHHTYFDSYELQFTGSERYLRGISLVDGKDEDHFSAEELQGFKDMSRKLNQEERGDQAAFIFTKKQNH